MEFINKLLCACFVIVFIVMWISWQRSFWCFFFPYKTIDDVWILNVRFILGSFLIVHLLYDTLCSYNRICGLVFMIPWHIYCLWWLFDCYLCPIILASFFFFLLICPVCVSMYAIIIFKYFAITMDSILVRWHHL